MHTTTPKGIKGYDQYTVSNDCSCRTYSLLSTCTCEHISVVSRAILSNFFGEQGRKKLPTIPFGIVACPFSDNLSRNSCILCPVCLAPPFSKYAIPSSPYLFSTHASLQNPLVPVLLQNKTISYSSSFLKT